MDSQFSAPWWISVLPLFNLLLFLAFLAAGIYAFVLFVKFARLGIKAFEIYIEKNKSDKTGEVKNEEKNN